MEKLYKYKFFIDVRPGGIVQPNGTYATQNYSDFFVNISLEKTIKPIESYIFINKDNFTSKIERNEFNPFFNELHFFNDIKTLKLSSITKYNSQFNISLSDFDKNMYLAIYEIISNIVNNSNQLIFIKNINPNIIQLNLQEYINLKKIKGYSKSEINILINQGFIDKTIQDFVKLGILTINGDSSLIINGSYQDNLNSIKSLIRSTGSTNLSDAVNTKAEIFNIKIEK